ncbi:MAG: SUMF1/EgtB/PvdO family nonheme iron enzyme [Tepidisphaeraceae bacterium]
MRSKMRDSRAWAAYAVIAMYGIVAVTSARAQATFSWATIGNPGNAADTATGYGSIDYTYQISKYDVTNSQYVQFLNAVDPTGANSLGLYTTGETSNAVEGVAFNSAAADDSKYSVETGKGNQPVVFVSWDDAARFVNWLSNGQGSGGTESGVYDMTQTTPTRATNSTYFIPTENEWYKAAYYDPTLNGGTGGYWTYATRSNTLPGADAPPGGSNSANYYGASGYAVTQSTTTDPNQDYLTDAGAYSSSTSYYGTFDETGDVFQWNETVLDGSRRGIRGGSWNDEYWLDLSSAETDASEYLIPDGSDGYTGFRVAMVPEPVSGVMLLTMGVMALMHRRPREMIVRGIPANTV